MKPDAIGVPRGKAMKIIDLTHTIEPAQPVFPGDPSPRFRCVADYPSEGYRETEVTLGSHTGTHVDAPAHVVPGGNTVSQLSVECFCGTAAVLRLPSGTERIMPEHIARCAGAETADFLLISTGWERLWGSEEYFRGYPLLDEQAAQWLVSAGKKGVGLDVMSIDAIDSVDLPLHRLVLGGGVVIVENLCHLGELPCGAVKFCALPLKLKEADGAPVRAMAFVE
ncbi:MAG: cyclase family protein [Pyramidobacter sp.]|jgi:arylformamidase